MTKETKVRLLQTILNAGIGGTDREMLDNLKAVIKAIESEGEIVIEHRPLEVKEPVINILPKKKPGRPFKKR